MPRIGTTAAAGAATEAKQDTQIVALQLIDDLQKALASIATDQLRVDIISGGGGGGDASAANQLIQITALQLIDDLRNALGSVNTDDLQVDVKTSGLPTGAATEAKQDTQITALQIIDNLPGDLTKQASSTPVSAVLFDSAAEAYTSASINCSGYRKFLLEINLDVTLAPTDIQIFVQFSDDNTTFYNYMNGPFGCLLYEDAAGDKLECVSGDCLAAYIRIYVLSSGCSATATFLLTCKLILTR